MNIEIKAMHYALTDGEKAYIDRKIGRIRNAENMIIDLIITVSRDSNAFAAEAMVNFKWGGSAIVKERDFEVNAAIDRMIDKLEVKITKEKEKNQGRLRPRHQ